MIKVWVLWWRYSDGSGSELVRAYSSEQRAKEDFGLVDTSPSSQCWKLDAVPLYADPLSPAVTPKGT